MPPRLTLHVPELGGTLTFLTCETRDVGDCYDLARLYSEKRQNVNGTARPVIVRVTGGGGYQFARGFAEVSMMRKNAFVHIHRLFP
jgi:pantothenate kinase